MIIPWGIPTMITWYEWEYSGYIYIYGHYSGINGNIVVYSGNIMVNNGNIWGFPWPWGTPIVGDFCERDYPIYKWMIFPGTLGTLSSGTPHR